MKDIFRFTVIGSLILYVVWFLLPHAWIYLYGEEEIALLTYSNYGAKFNDNGPLLYIFMIANVVSSLGLLQYKKWARTAFFALTVFPVFLSLISGFLVSPPFDTALGYIVTLLTGSIVTMSYLTSVGEDFS